MTNPLVRLLRSLRFRPRLLSSIALGVAVWLWLPMSWAQHAPTRALLAWNAGAIAYLASPAARHITGATLNVDGIPATTPTRDDGPAPGDYTD